MRDIEAEILEQMLKGKIKRAVVTTTTIETVRHISASDPPSLAEAPLRSETGVPASLEAAPTELMYDPNTETRDLSAASRGLTEPSRTQLLLPSALLDKVSQATPALLELSRFAVGARYEAYFAGGKTAQVTKLGNLSNVQHDGKRITETAKLRSLRSGQIANLGFSFLTVAVGMEHMARIDCQLARLNEKVDEIAAVLTDGLLAPVKDIAASLHRYNVAGDGSVPRETTAGWIRDLRRVRQQLISKIERIPDKILPSTSWWWGSQLEDLRNGGNQVEAASYLIAALATSDEMLHHMSFSLAEPYAIDGVETGVVMQLAREIDFAATKLMKSTDKDCGDDNSRQRERFQALGAKQNHLQSIINEVEEAKSFRDLRTRLLDEDRSFCLTVDGDKIVGLSEILQDDLALD